MIATRLTSLLLFVLSLGFLVCAAPSPKMPGHKSQAISARGEGGRMSALSTLEGSLRKQLDSCTRIKTVEEAKALVGTITTYVQTASDSVAKVGKLNLDDHGKTDVAVRVASCLSLIAKILIKLCQTLGSDAIGSMCGGLAGALKSFLFNIGACVEGVFPLVVKKIADVKTEAIMKQYFAECAQLLGLTA
ncbi:unnamed protein product [Rhizoctonia solani]|uniref:Transmembrane protein n=2 Tax=Rhizoctonia solani TaxID=456999 RepID=A0A8H3CT90_9AGAM|nr:putative transmembrane protein [Rhizoctonia solani 123E]CAE6497958.1 unnamed protein product [Rhizoctonia solani]